MPKNKSTQLNTQAVTPQNEVILPNEPKRLFNKNFVLMLQGNAISAFGDVLYSVAIGYFVYTSTGSEALMGIFTSIGMFMSMFLSPITGSLVDRIDRKIVVVGMDAFRGFLMLLIGYLALNNHLNTNLLVVFTVLISFSNLLFRPAASTIMLDIVPKKDFVQANSIVSAGYSVIDMISRGISGYLLVYVGVGELIIFNGISFLISALTEYFIAVPRTPKQGSKISVKNICLDLVDGFKTIITMKGLNSIFFSAIFINFFLQGLFSLLLVFTTQKGFSVESYGLMMSFSSFGGLLGAILISSWKMPNKQRPIVFVGSFILSLITCAISLYSNNVIVTSVFFLICQFFMTIGNMLLNASFMLLIPTDKRATVLGFLQSSCIGGGALSTVFYGAFSEIYPIATLGIIGSILAVIPIALISMDKHLLKIIADSGISQKDEGEKPEESNA
ncbi:MAG: MFS transporter [Oscillospiraceae bacterium]